MIRRTASRALLTVAAVVAFGVGIAAHAANPCNESRKLDMAKAVGHARGLAEASRIVLEKTGDEALGRSLYYAAIAKQVEADRQLDALLRDRCQ